MPQLNRFLANQIIRAEEDPTFQLWTVGGVLQPEGALLLYELGQEQRRWDEIEDDPFMGRLCEERRQSPSLREPIVYAGGKRPQDELAAEIIRKTIDRTDFDRFCVNLNHAVMTGRSFGELIWEKVNLSLEVEESEVQRECMIPIGLEPKDPLRLVFARADNPKKTQHHYGFEARQLTLNSPFEGEPMPLKKVVLHSYGSLVGNPYGKGVYRRLHWLVHFKKEVLRLGLVNCDGRPIPHASYARTGVTQEELRSAELMMRDFYKNSWMVLPEDIKIGFATAFVQGQVDSLRGFLNWFDTQAATTVLGATLTSQTDSNATRGDTSVHFKVTEARAKSDSDLLSESIREYFIKPIVQLNCPADTALPTIYRDFTESLDRNEEAEVDEKLFVMGWAPSEERMHEVYGGQYERVGSAQPDQGGAGSKPDRQQEDEPTDNENPIAPDDDDATDEGDTGFSETVEFGWIIKRKLNLTYNGYSFSVGVELLPGDTRFAGTRYARKLRSGYGHLRSHISYEDGEALDAYLHRSLLDNPTSASTELSGVWAIEQLDPKTEELDELKLILGVNGPDEAIDLYLREMPERFFGGIFPMGVEELQGYRRSGVTEPVGDEDADEGEFAEGRYSHINFTPPQSVRNAAKRGLELRAKQSPSNRGGLSIKEASKQGIGSGVARARDLASGRSISPRTARRMKAFFDRHSAFKDKHKSEPEGKARVSWLLWGGDSGYSWAKKLCRQMDAADGKSNHAEEEIEFEAGDRFKHKKLWRKAYNEARRKFTIFPSAYSSAFIVQAYKRLVKEAGLSVTDAFNYEDPADEVVELSEPLEDVADFDLKQWFREDWVRIGNDGSVMGPCGDRDDSEGFPKCLPRARAESMSKEERAAAVRRKRRKVKRNHQGKPIHVATKSDRSDHGEQIENSDRDDLEYAEAIEVDGDLLSDEEFDAASRVTADDVLAAIDPILNGDINNE